MVFMVNTDKQEKSSLNRPECDICDMGSCCNKRVADQKAKIRVFKVYSEDYWGFEEKDYVKYFLELSEAKIYFEQLIEIILKETDGVRSEEVEGKPLLFQRVEYDVKMVDDTDICHTDVIGEEISIEKEFEELK